MSVSVQRGGLAVAIQTDKNTENTTAGDFTSYAVVSHSINPINDVQNLPDEVGGVALPQGIYKLGYTVAGQATMVVRLTNIGKLLYGVLGKATSSKNAAGTVGHHRFHFDPNDHFSLPWLTVRRSVGGEADLDVYVDCRIVSLRLQAPARGPLMATIGFLGREARKEAASIPKPSDSHFATGCKGSLGIGIDPNTQQASTTLDTAHKFLGAELIVVNETTTPDVEQTIGSYTMDDIVVLRRSLTMNLAYKWADRALYEALAGIAATTAAWKPKVQMANFELVLESPDMITGSTPYDLRLLTGEYGVDLALTKSFAGNMALAFQPLDLAAPGIVTMGISGTLQDAGGATPFTIMLSNEQVTAYDGGTVTTEA